MHINISLLPLNISVIYIHLNIIRPTIDKAVFIDNYSKLSSLTFLFIYFYLDILVSS